MPFVSEKCRPVKREDGMFSIILPVILTFKLVSSIPCKGPFSPHEFKSTGIYKGHQSPPPHKCPPPLFTRLPLPPSTSLTLPCACFRAASDLCIMSRVSWTNPLETVQLQQWLKTCCQRLGDGVGQIALMHWTKLVQTLIQILTHLMKFSLMRQLQTWDKYTCQGFILTVYLC